MSLKLEKALDLFRNGASCSQAVLVPFCETYGLDAATAMRLSCGFGGGAKCGELCGAISGAVMVASLKHGHADPKDKEGKKACGQAVSTIIEQFKRNHTELTCRGLLGCDTSTPEGFKHARDNKLFGTVCVAAVTSAVEILEAAGY